MQVGTHVYMKLGLIGEHKADDVYFESISKETFEAHDHSAKYYIGTMRTFPSNTGNSLGGVELECYPDSSKFSIATNVKRDLKHTMDLSCFEGDIIAVKLENSDKLLCWRFESDYHSIDARFNPISDMYKGKLGRKKLIE